MACSGRKQTDMKKSIAFESAEEFENECEPCLTIGQHKVAHVFCVKCQEYLCKTCKDCHKKTKGSRKHQLLGRDEFDKLKATKKSSKECTEKCKLHQKKLIKSSLGCNDLMIIGHRNCKIDYIPDKCMGTADRKYYKDIMVKLKEKLKEAEEVSKMAERSRNDINDINKEITKKIEDFRAEINDRLDQMQHDILNKVGEKRSNNETVIKKVIDTCGGIISEVKKLKSNIRANKSNNDNGKVYIDIKQAETELNSDILTEAREKVLTLDLQYSFRRSAELENLLSKEVVFGDLITSAQPAKTKLTIDQLIIKDKTNIKTESDRKDCWITGCDVLSSNKLVIANSRNNKLKVVSVNKRIVLQEKILESGPWDIAVMFENLFAVTIPFERRIDVMTTDGNLSHVRSIKVGGKCYGIDFHQDRLYVVCLDPPSVVVLTTQGNVLNKIPLNILPNYCYPYIAVRKDSNLIIISDHTNNRVTSVTPQGDVSATYSHEDLQGPLGLCLLDDGSLLVCCNDNDTIHQIKVDFKEGKKVGNNSSLWSICYNRHNDEVYAGCEGNQLKVFSTK